MERKYCIISSDYCTGSSQLVLHILQALSSSNWRTQKYEEGIWWRTIATHKVNLGPRKFWIVLMCDIEASRTGRIEFHQFNFQNGILHKKVYFIYNMIIDTNGSCRLFIGGFEEKFELCNSKNWCFIQKFNENGQSKSLKFEMDRSHMYQDRLECSQLKEVNLTAVWVAEPNVQSILVHTHPIGASVHKAQDSERPSVGMTRAPCDHNLQ